MNNMTYIMCTAGIGIIALSYTILYKDNTEKNYNEKNIYCASKGYKGFIGTNDDYSMGNCYQIIDGIIILGKEPPK